MAFTSVKNKKKTISAAAAVFMSSKTVALIIIITMALMTVMLIIEGGGSGGGGPRLFAEAKPITPLKVPKWPTSGRGPLQGPAPLPAPPTIAPLLKNGELELLAPALPLLCPPEQNPQAFSPDLNFKVNRALEKAMAAERRRKCELMKEEKEKEKDLDVVDIISGDDDDEDQDQDFEYYQQDIKDPKDQKNQTYQNQTYQDQDQDQDQDQMQKLPQASAQKQLPYFPTYYRTDKPKPKAKEPQEPDVEHLRPPFYHHPSFIAVAASALIIGLYHLITKWEQVWTFCYECVNGK